MRVISCNERWPRRVSADTTFKREYERSWVIVTDDRRCSQISVITAAGLPPLWSPLVTADGFDLGSRVQKLSAEQDADDPFTWIAKAEYSTKAIDPQRAGQDPYGNEG